MAHFLGNSGEGQTDTRTFNIGVTNDDVVFVYAKRTDLGYKVNYLEKDSGKVLKTAKAVDKQTFKDVIYASDEIIEIEDYKYDSASRAWLMPRICFSSSLPM